MTSSRHGPGGDRNWGLFIAVPVCLLLAVYFIASSLGTPYSPTAAARLDPAWDTPKTAREDILKNKVMVGNCYLCHAYWVGIPNPDVVQPRFAHPTVKLDHGANNRCYNCHLIRDRNKYAANDGSGIVPANVAQLCARCHGLIHQDWQAGTHGVRRGKWNAQTPFERINVVCTECHDPHSPRFKFKQYAPPPVWPDKFIRRRAETFEH